MNPIFSDGLLDCKICSAPISLFPRSDLGLVVQNHVQQGITDFQFSVVVDKAQLTELVHEKAYSRSGRADHLRHCFLTDLSHDRLRLALLAEIRKKKEKSGETLFARIEQLIDQVLFSLIVRLISVPQLRRKPPQLGYR
jgi:hypothetical protein